MKKLSMIFWVALGAMAGWYAGDWAGSVIASTTTDGAILTARDVMAIRMSPYIFTILGMLGGWFVHENIHERV